MEVAAVLKKHGESPASRLRAVGGLGEGTGPSIGKDRIIEIALGREVPLKDLKIEAKLLEKLPAPTMDRVREGGWGC